eukprot:Clim_evm104s108 gene=Clim_evmTU104s108
MRVRALYRDPDTEVDVAQLYEIDEDMTVQDMKLCIFERFLSPEFNIRVIHHGRELSDDSQLFRQAVRLMHDTYNTETVITLHALIRRIDVHQTPYEAETGGANDSLGTGFSGSSVATLTNSGKHLVMLTGFLLMVAWYITWSFPRAFNSAGMVLLTLLTGSWIFFVTSSRRDDRPAADMEEPPIL